MDKPILPLVPPNFPGLTWQAVTPDDLAFLKVLADECHAVDGGYAFMNDPETLSERYFPDTQGTAIGAFTSGTQMAACSSVYLNRQPGLERAVITGQVHPDLRGRGIGTYLMHWSQVQALSMFPEDAAHRLLQVATESLTDPAHCLYLTHGFEQVFEALVMRFDLHNRLPEAPPPDGVTLINWQPELAEQFFQAYQAAFRDRPGFPGWSAQEWISRVLANDFRPDWTFLALDGDVPAGFVIGNAILSTTPPGGDIWQIGVVPEARRRGLGRALLVETLRHMQAEGVAEGLVTVHIDNPGAIQAYRQLGFSTAGRRARYERRIK